MLRIQRRFIQQLLVFCAWLFAVAAPIVLGSGCRATPPRTGLQQRSNLAPGIEAALAEFREAAPRLMRKSDVPGCAVALVDRRGIIYAEGFGYAEPRRRTLVTPDTIFVLCSTSKPLTTTAILLAVQEGTLELDAPLTTYLPDFTVNSRDEAHPEQKLTLRRLLSHTSGLPYNPAVGNDTEPEAEFTDHIRGLRKTWLRFPVGRHYLYGNANLDLAAHVLQTATGMPFDRYVKAHLFQPLGMRRTTADIDEAYAALRRGEAALGHTKGVVGWPASHALLGSGGTYSSAADLASFVRFQLNQGAHEGRTLLEPALLAQMRRPHARTTDGADGDAYDGLGLHIEERQPEGAAVRLFHGGNGVGYHSLMAWWPEYGFGIVVLTNRWPYAAIGDLAYWLPRRLIERKLLPLRNVEITPAPAPLPMPWLAAPDHRPTPYQPQWKAYHGKHRLKVSKGFKLAWWAPLVVRLGGYEYPPAVKVYEKDGFLCVTEGKFCAKLRHAQIRQIAQPLQEYRPGLFFTATGATLDFTAPTPLWGNCRLDQP